MSFDPTRAPVTPRDAASVVLLRARAGSGAAEVFLLRRHGKASFMARSFVFPGGAADPEDGGDLRVTAARELFEEAGVLLVTERLDAAARGELRARLAAGASLAGLLAEHRLTLDLARLGYFAHWVTPSAEAKRFSARFYVAVLPDGQSPSFDNVETVDEAWVTPDEALARAGELRLPPPQVRTMLELQAAAARGPDAVLAEARARTAHVHPIVPRFAPMPSAPRGFALLLPWDPEYDTIGAGDGVAMPADHPLAVGPSRFVLVDDRWENVAAPS